MNASKECAVIGPTILIKGDLTGEEDLIIDGRVEGRVELRKHNITVGKNGRVKADLYGKVITVEGEVHGNLYSDEQLVLRQSSTVRGNILAPRVVLEDGANFKGSIDMSPKEAAQRDQAPPAATAGAAAPGGLK
jgi:cytoskeletal protein CcmA (bactofilin family)